MFLEGLDRCTTVPTFCPYHLGLNGIGGNVSTIVRWRAFCHLPVPILNTKHKYIAQPIASKSGHLGSRSAMVRDKLLNVVGIDNIGLNIRTP